jgi:hypothetical protein
VGDMDTGHVIYSIYIPYMLPHPATIRGYCHNMPQQKIIVYLNCYMFATMALFCVYNKYSVHCD